MTLNCIIIPGTDHPQFRYEESIKKGLKVSDTDLIVYYVDMLFNIDAGKIKFQKFVPAMIIIKRPDMVYREDIADFNFEDRYKITLFLTDYLQSTVSVDPMCREAFAHWFANKKREWDKVMHSYNSIIEVFADGF